MRSSNEQTLKEAIQSLLETYRLNRGMQETKLINSWDKVAGSFVAKNTESLHIRNKTLFIKINSPALKNELSFAKSKLIHTLNKGVNQEIISDIVFL